MLNHHPQAGWWGKFSADTGQTLLWKIGPLNLAVRRLANEWQIAFEPNDTVLDETNSWQHNPTAPDLDTVGYAHLERYTFNETHEFLIVMPALADRPVIIRPLTPFYVTPNQEAVIYLSTPLWVRVDVHDPPQFLQEIPVIRPSDTWFGPSTREGELGYAGRTHSHLNFENVASQAYRAITQVIIRNRTGTSLLIERLSLPVPYLTLFESADGQLWTQTVIMTSTRETGMATFDIDTNPPKQAGQVNRIGEPRQQSTHNMVIRAFGALFG